MRIGAIGTDAYSFYNSASRAASVSQADRIAAINGKESTAASNEREESVSAAIYQRDDYAGPTQTQLSTDNLYQKQKLSTAGTDSEKIADKLMDSLPKIFDDMKKVEVFDDRKTENTKPEKIVINENDPVAEDSKAAERVLENISF